MIIIVDSREKTPLYFRKSSTLEDVVVEKLDAGDYSIKGYEDKIAIERKSPNDLFGTLGKGHKRFKKELERAKDYDYFCILVECSLTTVLNKEFEGAHYCQMLGDTIVQIAYTLKMKYGVDIVFCNGKSEAVSYVRQIFRSYLKQKKADKLLKKNIKPIDSIGIIGDMLQPYIEALKEKQEELNGRCNSLPERPQN